ncbi:MAG: tRNA (adenosine(37)-N6)-threonylcarbamoyltransferase complex dimerization subunit type 1 TsaB [Kiritimatiellae bacterium]|nr:tRNA (adenosine(37)-N6)-threonylcarbamoyltransferase complex dimerization subunit type 1 TsaB [Kiritimatiellia bacterium]
MNTLVIDRSTDRQSVAFVDGDGRIDGAVLEGMDCRSGDWTVRVERFLAGRRPDRIVVGTGPGSFAGIRAALAFAQGYAIGSGCEVAGLPSPCALAADDGPVAVVGDARRGMFWIALFEGRRMVCDVFQTDAESLGGRVPRGARIVSPDDRRIGERLRELFGDAYAGEALPTAEGLSRYMLADPTALRPEPLPIYLNPAVRP